MKMKWCVTGFLLLALCAGIHLYAEQTDTERAIFKDTMAKAENGDAASQCAVAELYANGILGVKQNKRQAFRWFLESAVQGCARAEDGLGVCYRDGIGVSADAAEAAKWFRKAANQGFAEAELNLGVCYFEGKGIEKNAGEGVKWLRKSAEQGLAGAQYDLGNCYSFGNGVKKDDTEAVKWFHRAANQGYADAQYNLGACYANGNGVAKDYIEAYKWENLASAQGNQLAKTWLLNVESRMTPEQIAEAQQFSREFVPRKEMPSSGSDSAVLSDSPKFSGTGFFITDDGYLISNYHVVKDAAKVRLLTGAGLIDAKVVQVDAANDLALLKANAEGRMKNEETFKPLPIAASRTVKLGATATTVGFPDIGLQGFAPKLAKGEIASLSGASDDPRYFQISAPVQPGNSGGALVDERGNVIGIVSAKLDASVALAASGALPENVNYAVKSSFLLSFLESVPAVDAKLKKPNTADEKFEDVVKDTQAATVLVLVY